ncbi:hypothetical protein BDY24DRAFT_378667 [Mrakia frigida]|uniref:uncharacterized protein n=1 Tax=Mrakia frigida TaxID=29902 RepID=UPI003FCC1D6F
MPSLYPILLSLAIIGSIGVVYETCECLLPHVVFSLHLSPRQARALSQTLPTPFFTAADFAESVEDWFSELVERRREVRRSRERKIRVEQGFEGNGGDENEGRKSWETNRERELDELSRREGLAASMQNLEGQRGIQEEEEMMMRRSWNGFPGESSSSGGGGGGLLGGGGEQAVRRRTNSRLGSRDEQLVDFGTLLKPSSSSLSAPPPTQILFTYSSPLPTPSTLPPLPPLPASPPPSNISSSPSSPSRSPNSIHFPSASSSSSLSFASLSLSSPLASPSLLDRPPSTSVPTSWAHIPPSSSLVSANDEEDARSQTLTLRSGSTGLLVSASDSTRSWAAAATGEEEGWSARSSLDFGAEASDVESVWSEEGAFESAEAGGSLGGSSLGREDDDDGEEGWSDVGRGSVGGGR